MTHEPTHEFSEFELQLRRLSPIASSLTPEETFYRAGFEAARHQNLPVAPSSPSAKSSGRFGLGMFVGVAASMLTMLTMQSFSASSSSSLPPTIAQNQVETLPSRNVDPTSDRLDGPLVQPFEVRSEAENTWLGFLSIPQMIGIPISPSTLAQPIQKPRPDRPRMGLFASTPWSQADSFDVDFRPFHSMKDANRSSSLPSSEVPKTMVPIHRFSSPEQLRLEGLL